MLGCSSEKDCSVGNTGPPLLDEVKVETKLGNSGVDYTRYIR
jgi:hypothetical protein